MKKLVAILILLSSVSQAETYKVTVDFKNKDQAVRYLISALEHGATSSRIIEHQYTPRMKKVVVNK